MSTNQTTAVLFQSPYGAFQARYLWFFPVLGVIGAVGVPLGVFWNEGWEMGGRPLEPWSATLIIEIFAGGALLLVAVLGAATYLHRKSPQRVAVTDASLIVPKGMFSRAELVLPRSEINVAIFDVGIVKQLQIKHRRRTILLSSALFPSDADFDRLASYLR